MQLEEMDPILILKQVFANWWGQGNAEAAPQNIFIGVARQDLKVAHQIGRRFI